MKKAIALQTLAWLTAAPLAGVLLFAVPAFAGTGFLTGERTTGMTKQCYYDYLGSEYVKTQNSVSICPLSISVESSPSRPYVPQPPTVGGGTGFLKGEKATGMTKLCYYDYLGSEYVRTLSSVSICPLSIKVR